MPIFKAAARQAGEQCCEEGYALVRKFIDGDELLALKAETDRIYREGLKHHATWRNGNLALDVLPESDFGRRYVIQAYWMSWISAYFERFRRAKGYFTLLESILGPDIKQFAQQIHWKPPGAGLPGYRFHQDFRFRAFALSSYVRAGTTERGEWAFRNRVSTPIGDSPRLCKFERLHENPDPHYVEGRWYA